MSEFPRGPVSEKATTLLKTRQSTCDDLPLFAAAKAAPSPGGTHRKVEKPRQPSRRNARPSETEIVSKVRALMPEITGADLAEAKFVLEMCERHRTLPIGCVRVAKALIRRTERRQSNPSPGPCNKTADIVFLKLSHNRLLVLQVVAKARSTSVEKRGAVLNAEARRLMRIARARGEPASIAVPDVASFLRKVERTIAALPSDLGHGGGAA